MTKYKQKNVDKVKHDYKTKNEQLGVEYKYIYLVIK